jgi:hypothetical protein
MLNKGGLGRGGGPGFSASGRPQPANARIKPVQTICFKKVSGTVAGTARKVLCTTAPDTFVNHATI